MSNTITMTDEVSTTNENPLESMSREQLIELAKGLSELIASNPEKVKKAVSRSVTQELKDKGVANYSATYYREKFALEVKLLLDEFLAAPVLQPQLFDERDFNLSKSSLYMRIYHGWKYLCDFLDPDGVYKQLRNRYEIKRHDAGVLLELRGNIAHTGIAKLAHEIKESVEEWKSKLYEYLETGKIGEKFEIQNILLSDDEVGELQLMFESTPHLYFDISNTHIKMVKMPQEIEE